MNLMTPTSIVRYLIRGALDRYRQDGVIATGKTSVAFLTEFVKNGFSLYPYQDIRTDLGHRWEMLEPFIDETDGNLLDIGCAEGYVTKRATDRGLFAVGIDTSEARITKAKSRYTNVEGLLFWNFEITPDNVESLPAFDITCLLTVYHIFCMEYGRNAAEKMLRSIGRQSGKIFFEPPGEWSGPHPFEDADQKPINEAYGAYLSDIFDDEADAEFVGFTEMGPDTGENPVFVVHCQDY